MKLSTKIGVALVIFIVAAILIIMLAPEGSALIGLPGALFIGYVVTTVYHRNKTR